MIQDLNWLDLKLIAGNRLAIKSCPEQLNEQTICLRVTEEEAIAVARSSLADKLARIAKGWGFKSFELECSPKIGELDKEPITSLIFYISDRIENSRHSHSALQIPPSKMPTVHISPTTPTIRSATPTLLRLLERMAVEENPFALIASSLGQEQIAINDGFLDILAVPASLAAGRKVRLGWNPPDLEECLRRGRQESRFELSYGSALNRMAYAQMRAEVEFVTDPDSGVTYRLNKNLGFDLRPFPERMLQLCESDW